MKILKKVSAIKVKRTFVIERNMKKKKENTGL